MLEFAYFHRNAIGDLVRKKINPKTLSSSRYRFIAMHAEYNFQDFEIDSSTWKRIQMVSIVDDKILGFFSATFDRNINAIVELLVVSFSPRSAAFSRDFRKFFTQLFTMYNVNKITWGTVVANPAMKMYDHYVEKYGGRVVGVFEQNARLPDGKLYDVKYYEMKRDEVFKKLRSRDK